MELTKLRTYLARRRRARQVGFPLGLFQLGRATDFTRSLPSDLLLNGRRVPVSFPNEPYIRNAFLEVIIDDEYHLHSFPHPVKTVLDIGGNVGLFSFAARAAFPDAQIHTYEPNRALEPYLRVQQAVADFTLYLEAVQKENGFVHLSHTDNSLETSTTPSQDGDTPATAFRIAVERIGGEVDFLKLDCEGAEWEILEDIEALRRVRFIAMEYHRYGGQTDEDALSLVQRSGFRIVRHTILPYGDGLGFIHATRL